MPTPSSRERLAAALLRERRRRLWTQDDAAEACGIDPRQYGRIERAETWVRLSTFDKLADGFGLEPGELLRRPRARRRRQ